MLSGRVRVSDPRTVLAGLVGVVVVAALVVVLPWVLQRRLIYLPSTAPVPPAGQVLPGARDVVLHTSDGLALGAWFVRRAPGTGV